MRRGPLVIFASDNGISKAFRNLPGIEVACVDRLNLLQLAPGGHLGRFCIWTKSAFEKLDKVRDCVEEEGRMPWFAWRGVDGTCAPKTTLLLLRLDRVCM